jgi:hypothetical protein
MTTEQTLPTVQDAKDFFKRSGFELLQFEQVGPSGTEPDFRFDVLVQRGQKIEFWSWTACANYWRRLG